MSVADQESVAKVTAERDESGMTFPGVSTPDSAGRPKSTTSSDIVFEAKKKKKRGGTSSHSADDDVHDVTFTVTICMGVPTALSDLIDAEHDDQLDVRQMLKKRMIDAPRAQNYYHLEYHLLPDEDELMKTDIVTYGVACKIYMEKHDARVVKTWQEGDLTWFSWAHSHTMTVTKDMLLKMFNHTIELRVWDTKDKCSSRARFDRPKAFRLPAAKPGEKPEDIGGVKAMVTKQMKNFVQQQPKKGIPIRPLPSQISVPSLVDARKFGQSAPESRLSRSGVITPSANTKNLVAVPNKDGKEGRAFSRLGQLAGADRLEESSSPRIKKGSQSSSGKKEKSVPSTPIKSPSNSRTARSNITSMDNSDDKSQIVSSQTDREFRKQLADHAKARAEHIKKNGVCMIPLRLALLFGDTKVITNRLEQPISGVEDLFLGVSLNAPLLSPTQKQELNPMSIQIKNATNMPSSPLSYADLQLKCHPAYCKYQFFKEPEHLTAAKDHTRDIYWEDSNFFLLGTMEKSELREYFQGPAMEIEVHDRDRKPEEVKLKPMLFGDDLEDEKIANVGTVESRRTLHNPFHGRNKPWDPYGIAKIDLSDLLLGHRFLELKVPIQKCPIPDVLGQDPGINDKLMGIAGAVDGPIERPMTAGNYISDTAMLKVKIELAHPLISPAKLAAKEDIATTKQCPFNRIIFVFDYNNIQLLNNLQALIRQTNADALELQNMPEHVIDAALSTYKLSIDQQCSTDLDIITGFHLLDGHIHVFVLEGLRDKAISDLWNQLPQPENSNVKVLYNSDMSFGQRLYGPLDVDLCRVKLHEPLAIIVQQSLLYVRDMVVRACYEALIRLDQIINMEKMKDVVRNDLFLTSEMVVSMSREFGVPFTQKDLQELKATPSSKSKTSTDESTWQPTPYQAEPSRNWTPLDNFNQKYIRDLEQEKEKHNYVEENIQDVQKKSDIVHQEKERNKKPRLIVDMDPAFNYSTMALNSVNLAHRKLRQYLREEDPTARYAFNQQYMSAMYCPVDVVEEQRLADQQTKADWRTANGWIYPGIKSTKESNVHPRHLDQAQFDSLQEDWVENHLHTNVFKSPLERDHFPWDQRNLDLDLYTKPIPDFGNKEPYSIHLPGVMKEEEKRVVKEREFNDWKSRIIVDNLHQSFHRVLPETEMKMKGFYSSNQIDRQKPLLKDPPMKKGLQFPVDVNAIPSYYVVNDPRLDTDARLKGHALGPSIPESAKDRFVGFNPGAYGHTWSQNNNHIPCKDYRHFVFTLLKGQDFNPSHKNRNTFHRRPIDPLQPHEKDNHLFRTPVFSASPYQRPLPDLTPRPHTANEITLSSGRKNSTDQEKTTAFSKENENVSNVNDVTENLVGNDNVGNDVKETFFINKDNENNIFINNINNNVLETSNVAPSVADPPLPAVGVMA